MRWPGPGAHEDGLLWSMTSPGASDYASVTRTTVHLAASVGGKPVATSSLTRTWRGPGVEERLTTVFQEGFDGAMFSPPDTSVRRPAVLAFGGSEGGSLSGIGAAEALADAGYPALGIGYFRGTGLPDTLSRIPLEYFTRAIQWLARQPGVDPHRIDVFGVSRGSEAALLLGADFPGLVFGVIAGSPSERVNGDYPYDGQPAWTLKGHPVPAAIIPVERIRGPVFLVCGADDRLWPSCPSAQAIADRLGSRPDTEVQVPDAGHYVGSALAGQIATPDARVGGTQEADALGRRDAWTKLLAYLAAQSVPGASTPG